MCKNVHYKYCIRVSQSIKQPPKDYHHPCELHHSLKRQAREPGREGREARRELEHHERRAGEVTHIYHYGKQVFDIWDDVRMKYKQTCIVDPSNPIVQQRSSSNRDQRSDLWYLHCDGYYRNSYHDVIRKAPPMRIDSKGKVKFD